MNRRLLFGIALVISLACIWAEETTVKASSFGFDPQDATECLQKALNSGAAVVIVDKMEGDWFIRPVVVPSNITLRLEDDVAIRAKLDEYHDRVVNMIRVLDVDNVTIEGGKNSVIGMPKPDYLDTSRYCFSEWRHAIHIGGSHNVTVRNLLIDGSGGDGIGVNRGRTRIENRNVLIENVEMVNNHRLALGFGAVDGVIVRNCKFMDTMGTPPQVGMDFENNYPDEVMTNIRIENCLFTGNAAAGLMFILGNNNETTPPLNAVVENCAFLDNGLGSVRIDCVPGQKGEILFKHCRFSTMGSESICINNAQDNGIHIAFENCTMDATACKGSPIVFSTNRMIREPFGNVDLGDMVVKRESKAPLIAVNGLEGPGLSKSVCGDKVRIKDAIGNYTVFDMNSFVAAHPGNPALLEFEVRPYLTKEYRFPEDAQGKTAGQSFCFRGTSRFAQWVPADKEITVHFQLEKCSKRELTAKVELMDANGGLSDQFTLDGTEVFDYKLKAGVARGVMFLVRVGPNTVHIWSDGGGQGFPCENKVSLCGTDSEFYFWVLAGQREVKVEINAEEPLCVALYDAQGNLKLDMNPRFTGRKILLTEREPSEKDELWRIKCYRVAEDYGIRLGAPCYPILFTAPENAVIPK